MLFGKRVKLVPVEREHLGLLKQWRNDPDIRESFFSSLPCTDLGQEIWYDRMIRGGRDVFLLVLHAGEGAASGPAPVPIGYCAVSDIDWRKGRGVVSIILGEKEHWGKHLGVEVLNCLFEYAFSELALHKLYIYVLSDNLRSIELFKKFAPVEGQLAAHEFRDGQWKDVTLLGLTREVYFTQVRGKVPAP
ncbi:MAG TPA: GNAT family protein [Candidatus Saccharimonadales bacterium]|nr:GNAT family protein [Candidatus Saccharimonadales bacterium]